VLSDRSASAAQRARAERGLSQLGDWATPPAAAGALAVVPRAAWHARAPIPSRLDPVGGPYTRITVHHSDAVPGTRLDGSFADSTEALRKIQHEHVDGRGYGDIGYHYLIDADGRVFEGRPVRYQGAHARGGNNVQNLGVCLLGDFEHRAPGPEQMASLERFLEELRAEHHIPRQRVYCHRDFTNTVCPGEPLARWVEAYERGAGSGLAQAPSGRAQAAIARPKAAPAAWRRAPQAAAPTGGGVVR
jgi:hypothetical protein